MDNPALRILFYETWWSWNRPAGAPYTWMEIAGRGFNGVEATAWFIFAVLVFRRGLKYRRSKCELWYGVAFVLFGISDVIEAWILTSWLLWWKAINLVVLFSLRRSIMKRYYPDARVY
ncbi:MAG: hypothetical protein JSS49_08025 [Planctomycetes bacterium]|nr:hypothetical protein [Planctomycetota bacterium]